LNCETLVSHVCRERIYAFLIAETGFCYPSPYPSPTRGEGNKESESKLSHSTKCEKMKIMAMLPTYNEAENIKPLINDILALRDDMEVVVVDDNSPDGTWKIVKERSENNSRIHLVHRVNEKGRGSAGIAGFLYAVKNSADFIIEMDADFSHNPKYIPAFIDKMKDCDVVIGSRLIKGGGEVGRSFLRTLITLLANFYIRFILGLNIKDCTSGYRCFKREVLASIELEKMESNGPAIVQEVLYACKKKRFKMLEVPIIFENRRFGKSTFSTKIMMRGLISVLKFRFKK